ncbi:MAG TPA: Mov34/MPN/PAD-1 family protein, partial [Thermoanaerobaculia bacterium]|nr:Mov34/MPN/PAD-1 family protein [Thermoanaerobaculia bacterium]
TAALSLPQAHVWYDHLLAEGGYGRVERERAAFLILECDGALTLEPWREGGFRHATYRGKVPAGAIAILHTHPARVPEPSAHDRAEARRLGIPVVVITPSGVIAAQPSGERTPVRASGTSRAPSARRTFPPR